jgi:uncharacterized membrane protein
MTELVTPEPTTNVVDDPKRPWKAVVAILIPVAVAVVQAIAAAYTDEQWDVNDTIVVVLALLGALGVYLVPNPKAVADRAHY